MIFETIYESALKNELILIDNGYCRWHLRKDGQITIYEIISVVPGTGTTMLNILKRKGQSLNATSLFAKCPADLSANQWYARKGFHKEGEEVTLSGRRIILWRYQL